MANSEIELNPQDFETAVKTIDKFFGGLVEAIAGAIPTINHFIEELSDLFYQMYLNAGAPYGETDEGFLQWLQGLNETIQEEKESK